MHIVWLHSLGTRLAVDNSLPGLVWYLMVWGHALAPALQPASLLRYRKTRVGIEIRLFEILHFTYVGAVPNVALSLLSPAPR